MIKRFLVRVGLWLATRGGWAQRLAPTDIPPQVLLVAVSATKRQDSHWPGRDGECKRANVYAQLTNTFPTINKRIIALAIEEALCGEY